MAKTPRREKPQPTVPSPATPALVTTPTGVLLRVRVQPRASVERLEGLQADRLRLRLTAPPVEGAANAACIAFFAKALHIPRSHVHLQAGDKSRDKLIHITGVTTAQVVVALGLSVT